MQSSVLDDMKNFELYYQPLVCAETMDIAGAEALLRWSSEEHGQLSPVEFIPVLESYGLIGQVGRWVLEQSFTQLSLIHILRRSAQDDKGNERHPLKN